ncbi:hypothetical protein KBI33_00990 [Candidatus Shapirobacteria bacterium]|nr:hypothetical protein [Candidatus Shapirobacteria bacterium]
MKLKQGKKSLLKRRASFFLLLLITLFLAGAFLPEKKIVFSYDYRNDSSHPDLNLNIRRYEPIDGTKGLIDFSHPVDDKAPQFTSILENTPSPAIISLYQVYNWSWETNSRGNLWKKPSDAPDDFATLIGLETSNGQNVLLPVSGYDIGGGNGAMVIYASADSVTLKYTCEDTISTGYTVYLSGFNVRPEVQSLYNQLNQQGRVSLPAAPGGYVLGTATGNPLLVAVVDTGSFLDPRWKRDWWHGGASSANQSAQLSFINVCEVGLILKGASDICSQFEVRRERTDNINSPSPISEGEEISQSVLNDEITTINDLMPDFYYTQKIMAQVLKGLLPQELAENILLPFRGDVYFTHYAWGEEAGNGVSSSNSQNKYPKEKISLTAEWPRLAGAARGLLSFFPPDKNPNAPLSEFKFRLEDTGYIETDPYYYCRKGQETKKKVMSAPIEQDPELRLNNILVKVITGFLDSLNNIYSYFRKEEIKYEVFTMGRLPAGEETTKNVVDNANKFLPSQVIDSIENSFKSAHDNARAIKTTFNYNIRDGGGGVKPSSFFLLNNLRAHHCLQLCSLVPPDKDVSSLDPLCVSCDPNYYQTYEPVPAPRNIQKLCVWDEQAGGCDYYDPNGAPSCNGDPICEGGKCNPNEYLLSPDYANNGCSPPYGEGNECTSVCHVETFSPNLDGTGYGPCHYLNSNVCVRNDAGGDCSKLCNWACCAYQ